MAGMTYEEKLLTRYLLRSGMHWGRVGYIVGSMPNTEAIMEMFDYIVNHQEADQAELYSIALKILKKYESETE